MDFSEKYDKDAGNTPVLDQYDPDQLLGELLKSFHLDASSFLNALINLQVPKPYVDALEGMMPFSLRFITGNCRYAVELLVRERRTMLHKNSIYSFFDDNMSTHS